MKTKTPAAARAVLAGAMTEAELQAQIVALATTYGWRWFHDQDSRRNPGGFPDLVLVHARAGRLIFAELKKQDGRHRPGQKEWLADLNAVSDATTSDVLEFTTETAAERAGVRTRIIAVTWRPTDLLDGTINTMLRESRR